MRKHLLLASTAILPLLASGCSLFFDVVGRPTVQSVRAKITGLDFQGVSLDFDIDVRNPYPVALVSPRFRCALDIDGSTLLSTDKDTGVNIPAKDVGTIRLPARLNYAAIWYTCQKLRDAKEFTYRLHGGFAVSALGRNVDIPLSHTGTLPVLRAPRFTNVSIDFSDISLRGATVCVQADMENPNAFAVGVKNLGYVVRVEQTVLGSLTASTAEAVPAGKSRPVKLTGAVSASGILLRLIRGERFTTAHLSAVGSIETPFGAVRLPDLPKGL